MALRRAIPGVLALVAAAVALPAMLLGIQAGSDERQELSKPRALPVNTVPAEAVSSFQTLRGYTGTIVAARESELAFERAGKVIEVLVDQGEPVEAGQELAHLDTRHLLAQQRQLEANRREASAQLDELIAGPRKEQIAAAEAEVRNLVAQKQLQELNMKRRESLLETSAIVQEEYDSARFGLDAITARLDVAQQQLNELQSGTRPEQIAAARAAVDQLEASLASIQHDLEDSILQAPFAGTVAERFIDEGAVITPQSVVARIVEDSQLEAWVGLPVATAQHLAVGQPVTLRSALGHVPGAVKAVLPELDMATRTRRVVVDVQQNADLLPGQIVRLEVPEETAVAGIRLPTSALISARRGLWSCYAVVSDEDGQRRVQRRDVEVLHTSGEQVVVRGTLLAGEPIVADGTHRVAHGQLVEIVSTPTEEQEIVRGDPNEGVRETYSSAAFPLPTGGRG
jgi:multidrug efflux pump subunit AcrA (membrane-fusion protein)